MADHAVTQSSFSLAHKSLLVEPASLKAKQFASPLSADFGSQQPTPMASKSLGTPFSQASTAPDFGSPMLGTFSSDDNEDSDQDVLAPALPQEELPFLLLSNDPTVESFFVNAKEEVVKAPFCPDEYDEGVFELLSPTHAASEATMARFPPEIEKPINVFTSSQAEQACKGETSPLEGDDLAMLLLSGSPVAMSYFINAKEEFVKTPHASDVYDEGVFELLSPTHAASEATMARFPPDIEKPINNFTSSRAEQACNGEPSQLEGDDFAVSVLSGSRAAMPYFLDAKEEFVKTPHASDVYDEQVFELLSPTHAASEATMARFSSVIEKPITVFTSSRAEQACKGEPSQLEGDEFAMWLLSGSPVAMSYFIDAKEEFAKTHHASDVYDEGVFELLSPIHAASEATIARFSSAIAKPIHTFSSARAEAACKGETSLLENEDFALWMLSGSPAAAAYFIGAQEEFVKPCHSLDTFDWDVFELLSETHMPSDDILKRFLSETHVPVHTFSSSRAEFACQNVAPALGGDESM